jgi:hypothetical protein
MKECVWDKMKKNLDFKPKISPVLLIYKLSDKDLYKLILERKIYGFALVDIKSTNDANKFLELNWPPILRKMDVYAKDLPDWMNVNEKSFPRTTIVQSMSGTNILLHTDLLSFYLENGFVVSKIHKFYEYEGRKSLLGVHNAIYEARVAATIAKDDCRATAVKLTSNAMYGQTLMVSFALNQS